ncbi:hypothetical protein Q2T40_19090 [Winogradskyella maritima]|uniref:Uncharacterized protein n=1 Tax=Winogradskyella maritima TaxID=1517766 RepID=A0ABV8ADY4_9FLAO|nr:hypothetical protein [Winogradskyella maritima]
MSIQNVDIPDEFMLGETYEISMDYTRPNGCYEFSDFIYQVDFNERTVAVVDAVFTDVNCTQATVQATVSFDFRVTSSEDYVFRFYQGQVDGEDQYLVVEVPVVE